MRLVLTAAIHGKYNVSPISAKSDCWRRQHLAFVSQEIDASRACVSGEMCIFLLHYNHALRHDHCSEHMIRSKQVLWNGFVNCYYVYNTFSIQILTNYIHLDFMLKKQMCTGNVESSRSKCFGACPRNTNMLWKLQGM